ncbi:adenylate/guanylate cyclase domain-containing protein [Sneathiella glossodoripedis]|uniref:adenylate/guanylate cyclase domain-containing protein n=1 Tax=Sneathiella glossodoripedis TaxID=418853 RepID=UPI000470BCF7|nr:adenylate/guanylate cyclase domain-containing protein [Sneathiella glossodoripedis]
MKHSDISTFSGCAHFPSSSEEEKLFAWLISAGMQQITVDELLKQLCERLTDLGVHLVRGNIAMTTLHPQVSAFMYTWKDGKGIVSNTRFLHTDEPGEGWFASPFFYMLGQGVNFMHRRLVDNDDLDFPVLREFKKEGMTDWFSQVFDFGWGHRDDRLESEFGLITSWASAHPDGFTERDFQILQKAIPLFALAVKGIASFEVAGTVLQTYVGQETAQEVLSGKIVRGAARSMTAVLLFADLKGFTRMADAVPRAEIVSTLDQYLERMADPITDFGGEVLKFMGDGMLATFVLKESEEADICKTAMLATQTMMNSIAELNDLRKHQNLPTVELDVALHIGEVMYGNVGSASRLDFTVVGPAVNEVSRMESLCDALSTHVVLSGEFVKHATHCKEHFETAGLHALRGVRTPKELYKLKHDSAYMDASYKMMQSA